MTALSTRQAAALPVVTRTRLVARQAWTLSVCALLAALFAITFLIHPRFDASDLRSLALGALPPGLAAVAETMVVLAAGIDLSVGALIGVANVLAATLMVHADPAQSIVFAAVVLVALTGAGLLNGLLIVLTGIPDIVVTLAMSFVWSGVALLIMSQPGGGVPPEFMHIGTGTLIGPWVPNALVLLVGTVAIVWLPIRSRRVGLGIRATGSDPQAAVRQRCERGSCAADGLRTRGLLLRRCRTRPDHEHRRGRSPGGQHVHADRGGHDRPRWREPCGRSRGRRRSAGRRPRACADLVGPDLPRRQPQLRAGHPGHDPGPGRHGRRPGRTPSEPVMSANAENPVLRHGIVARIGPESARRILGRPLVALTLLLLLLTTLVDILSPGSVTPDWLAATLVFAAPLGFIAAGQTLVILTGGIDLSVGTTATMALYVMATQSPHGVESAIVMGLAVGLAIGIANGLGVAVFQVQPLIMTLGMGLVMEGVLNVYAQDTVAAGAIPVAPEIIRELGAARLFGILPFSTLLWAGVAAVLIVALRRSGIGRLLFAVGTNRVACRLSGVRVWQVLLVTYAATGVLSAMGGILLAGATNVADRGLAEPYLLPSVAAVAIGGTSVFGGAGGYSGTILGALILTLVTGLLTTLNAPGEVGQIVYGGIILVVAAAYARVINERS